jgi:hypothetical protein
MSGIEGIDWRKLKAHQCDVSTLVADWKPPTVIPATWTIVDMHVDGAVYRSRLLELAVILSCSREADDRSWLHVSVSHPRRLPTWRELTMVKELFLGDREAYQVLPPKDRYINIHPNVLHLFALLDDKASALPDFTGGTGSL